MLVVGFLQWWYGTGWRDLSQAILRRIRQTFLNFSISSLLQTLFAPWRRIMSYSDGSIQQRMRAMVDNLVSRAVGFSVRIIVLITASALMVLTIVLGGLLVLIWPILPPLSLILLAGGLVW